MTSRRADDLSRQIAQLQRKITELERRASRQGHGHRLAYAESTSTQSSISTTEVDRTGLTLTLNIPAGRTIRVTGYTLMSATVDLNVGDLFIHRDGVQVAKGGAVLLSNGTATCTVEWVEVGEAAGSHTYKLRIVKSAGGPGGFISSVAATTAPAFILVEDLGPA